MLEDLFKAIDTKDVKGFSGFLCEDCVFRFGNLPPVTGAAEIRSFVANFFDSIDGLAHDICETWEVPGALVCHGFVTYRRKNGTELKVPFNNVLKLGRAGITEYLIFVDASALYQDS